MSKTDWEKFLENLQLADNERVIEQGDDYVIIEETICYTRQRKLHTFTCKLINCPYCQNTPQPAKHPTKKWCSAEARIEYRRRQRARQAMDEGRIPGSEGRPSYLTLGTPGIFYMLLLYEPVLEAENEHAYLIGSINSQRELTEFLKEHDLHGKHDTAIIILTYHPEELAEKIKQRYSDKQHFAHPADHYYLTEVRLAHQMTNEHVEAYNRIERRRNEI